jgi:hypothetical protein
VYSDISKDTCGKNKDVVIKVACRSGIAGDSWETYRYVRHGAKVVNLVRLHRGNDMKQVGGVGQIAVVQEQANVCLLEVVNGEK